MTTNDFVFALLAIDNNGNCYQVSVEDASLKKIINTNFKKLVISSEPIPTLMVEVPEEVKDHGQNKEVLEKHNLEATV